MIFFPAIYNLMLLLLKGKLKQRSITGLWTGMDFNPPPPLKTDTAVFHTQRLVLFVSFVSDFPLETDLFTNLGRLFQTTDYMYVCKWCVLAPWVFALQKGFALCKSCPSLYKHNHECSHFVACSLNQWRHEQGWNVWQSVKYITRQPFPTLH